MNNSNSENNNKLNANLKINEDNLNQTFSLFENDNFEINKSEDEYVSIEDNETEDENELYNDEDINYDDAISDNLTDNDLNNNYMSDDDDERGNILKTAKEEKEQASEASFKEENEMDEIKNKEKSIDLNIIGLKRRMKKKYINKKENIYYDEIGIYKNNKVMKNEDIEDRMKYLLLLLSNAKKSNVKFEKSQVIKELLFYYSYYYEYSKEMIKYLNYLFDVKELYLFLELNNIPKEIHLRTNTLKITRNNLMKILKSQNISVEEGDKWNNVGIVVNDINSNVGSLNEYLYGYYMIQSSSSFIPVLELNIQENDLALDLCAAPGGKCTFMCAIKKNKGIVYANDINKFRCKSIEAQASRMGINNLIVTCIDALKIHKHLTFQFDKILLDAPCSGTGVVNKNKGARRKTIKEIRELAQKQRKLLNNAINLLKNGGILVYSTCSITVEENEQVINYILKKRDVNLLPLNINIGDPGITHYKKKQFSSKISLCKRIYLHKHNHDNFFVAKLIKRSDAIFDKNKSIITKKEKDSKKKEVKNTQKYNKNNDISNLKENSTFYNKNTKVNNDNKLNNNKKVKKNIHFHNKKKEKHSNKLKFKKNIKNSNPSDKGNKENIFKEKEKKKLKNKTYNKNIKSKNKKVLLNESKQTESKKENKKIDNTKSNLSVKNKKIQKKFIKNNKKRLNKKNEN